MDSEMIDGLIAQRLGGSSFGQGSSLYKFERIKREKALARARQPDRRLIDLGVGEPDQMAAPEVVAALAQAAADPANRSYADNGIPEFSQAACRFMAEYFGVTGLDAGQQVLHGIGSKSLLAMLPACFIDPGDILLATVPGYGICATHTRYLGGEVYELPLLEANGFLPDLQAIPETVLSRAKLLYLNYPNNPTGAVATREFFTEVVAFARRHQLLVVHDAAYATLAYGGQSPLSILSIPGAMEVAVEIHSLSKMCCMTGWRMAFACGNSKAIMALAAMKDTCDSGQFRAIQKAAVVALAQHDFMAGQVQRCKRRMALLTACLSRVGFQLGLPQAGFYQYVCAPRQAGDGTLFGSAAECASYLLEHALVSVIPWDETEPYLRISCTFEACDEQAEQVVMADLELRLTALNLSF